MSGRPLPARVSRQNERSLDRDGPDYAQSPREGNSSHHGASSGGVRTATGRDRLGELRAAGVDRPPSTYDLYSSASNIATDSVTALLDEIKASDSRLARTKKSLPYIEMQQTRMLDALVENDRILIANDLEKCERETRMSFDAIKKKIGQIESKISGFQRGSADYVTVFNQLSSHKSRYQRTLQDFHGIRVEYSRMQKKRLLREMRIVNPQATEADVETMLENGEQLQIFSKDIKYSSRYDETKKALVEVKTRQADIVKLEETILMVHDLFIQVNDLIMVQDEQIAKIEVHAEDAVVNIEEGQVEVEHAIVSRKKQIGLLFALVIIIALVIAGVCIWYFVFNTKPPTS